MASTGWSAHQLAEFLAALSSFSDEGSATRGAVERAAEAFEAEVGAIVIEGRLAASVGYPPGDVPVAALLELASEAPTEAEVAGMGWCRVISVPLEERRAGRFLLARTGDAEFTMEEGNLLRSMGRVLCLTMDMLERQALLERLSKIQRSISHRAPLKEVLDVITVGAKELLGVEVAGLRLIDPDDALFALTVSAAGIHGDILGGILRQPINQGAGGRAIAEDRLVIIEDYENATGMISQFTEAHLQTAMAAPVHENGVSVGSLVVASYQPDRRFSVSEQDALQALAEHASLALTDAKTVEAMREAQRSKDMFLAMVSHELKTPLTVVMGALRTLEMHGDRLEESVRAEVLEAGWARGKELEQLINRLLQGARAELVPSVEDVDVEALVGESIRGFRHGRRIVVDTPTKTVVRIDRSAVVEVLGVLLENAVNHSEGDGEIRIDAAMSGSELSIAVANAGSLPAGLEPATLFLPFQRGDDAKSPGVGLGLYIAARVAESIQGCIEVTAEDGWVRFRLRVPVFEVGAGASVTSVPRAGTHAPAPPAPSR